MLELFLDIALRAYWFQMWNLPLFQKRLRNFTVIVHVDVVVGSRVLAGVPDRDDDVERLPIRHLADRLAELG